MPKSEGKRTSEGMKVRPPASRWRRSVLKALAISFPVLLLLGIELGLRVFGVGHPTSFFLRRTVDGQTMLVDNPRFGWRFFPRSVARTPEPVMFPEKKAAGALRVFVFGESAAMGDPAPSVGFPRMLQAMLEGSLTNQQVEVINVAMTAINSHVIREIAKDCAKLHGDVWVVYAGNNEVVGPFGGGTVFGPQTPPLGLIRLTLWLKKTRIAQLLENIGQSKTLEWEGMEMFLKQQVRHDDVRLKKVHEYFRRNLDDIVAIGQRAGARVIVSTVSVNLRDCPPFASQHDRPLSEAQEAEWRQSYTNAVAAELAGNYSAALQKLEAAAKPDGGQTSYAEWHFHRGRCGEGNGQRSEAAREYNQAKELDTLRFRTDDDINAATRSSAAASKISLIDAEKALNDLGSNGIAGAESFYEHVHLTFEGNYALAALFCAQITQLPTKNIPSIDSCARRLGWNPWKQREVFAEVRKRLQQPPFTAQFGHVARDRFWEKRIDGVTAELTQATLREIAENYRTVLQKAPNDWNLREDFAKVLAELKDQPGVIEQWTAVSRLLPHDGTAAFHLGNLADGVGHHEEAISQFGEALRRNPDMVEARNGLGLALSSIGRTNAAEREFRRALKTRPRFAQARVNLGQLLAGEGKISEARAEYEAALHADTNSAAAHVNLGRILSLGGDKTGAAAHYAEALRIDPGNAIAHFNMGNALVGTSPKEALRHYQAAVLAQPDFAEARYALAMEMARQNNLSEAIEQFGETVKLRPDMADAHFNYGVALAKTSRFNEAAREFRETLRLRPNDATAQSFLQKATAFGGK